jgi:hypothetical protein
VQGEVELRYIAVITLCILLTSAISNADDLFKNKDMVISVSQSEIRQNLTNYRGSQFISITLVTVFLTQEMSRKYKESRSGPSCPLQLNPNDCKYVTHEIRFNFATSAALDMGDYEYDRYDNLICGGPTMSTIDMNSHGWKTIFTKLRELFEEADRKDKSEPW